LGDGKRDRVIKSRTRKPKVILNKKLREKKIEIKGRKKR